MEDIKSAFGKITKTLTKTSGDLLKTTKLSVSLANEEEMLRSLYIEIGKKVHEIYTYGGTLGTVFDERNAEIVAKERKIKELREELDKVKGTKTCNKCGNSIAANSEFCNKCGTSININIAPTFNESIKKDNTAIRKCSNCGNQENTDGRYCLSCGRKY